MHSCHVAIPENTHGKTLTRYDFISIKQSTPSKLQEKIFAE